MGPTGVGVGTDLFLSRVLIVRYVCSCLALIVPTLIGVPSILIAVLVTVLVALFTVYAGIPSALRCWEHPTFVDNAFVRVVVTRTTLLAVLRVAIAPGLVVLPSPVMFLPGKRSVIAVSVVKTSVL